MNRSCTALLIGGIVASALLGGCGGQAAVSPASTQATAGSLTPGTYEGIGKGHGGEVRVGVVIGDDGSIREVGPVTHAESEDYGPKAVEELPGKIMAAQSLGVDAVSGATITSRAILEAVADAVTKAGGNPKALGYIPLAEISAADTITIKGLDGGEVTVTGQQLRTDYESVTVEATSVTASGSANDLTATGVTLEAILNKLGASQKDYLSIVTTATDGYSIEIPEGILKTRDIIIAYEVDGQPQSPRVVVPEERAMYWSKFLETVELMGQQTGDTAPVREILLLEGALAGMTGEDYKYYDSTDLAVSIADLLEQYGLEKTDFVSLASIDQWGKNEKYDTFAAQYIKYTGKDIPLFVGPSLPEGMRLKQTLFMRVGDVNIISGTMGQLVAKTPDLLAVEALFEIADMQEAPVYLFQASDGYTAEIALADIPKGSITIGEDGTLTAEFVGLDKNTTVKELLRITAKDV